MPITNGSVRIDGLTEIDAEIHQKSNFRTSS